MKPPEIIYKYRDWACVNHKKILTHNEIFLSSPANFNDPFDCKISTHYLSLDSPEKVSEFMSRKMEDPDNNFSREGIEVLEQRLNNIQEYWDMFEALEFTMIDKNFGVISLSARWNSVLMWSHYSNIHKGFCIGFNEAKMRESGLFNWGGLVNYSNDFPIVNPLDDDKFMLLQMLYKAKDWEYEQEYRLTKLFFPNNPTDNDRKIILEKDFIEEVILGMLISENDKNEIIKICREKSIRVFQAHRIPYKFEIKRFEI